MSRENGTSRRGLILGATSLPAVAAAESKAGVASDAAHEVLHRLIGRRASEFRFAVTPSKAPFYDYSAHRGHVTVKASSAVAGLYGAYAYLREHGIAHASWDGNQVTLPSRLPDGHSGRVEAVFAHRLYLNTCTFGYTTPFWDWPRWRREIDWMALHGIDMPLALEGQEWVWRALWQEEGLSDADLDAYFSGPAFTPWQRMGNIEGYFGPLPAAWMIRKRELQKRILGAMRELGMEPVLPAFAGYVPKAFAERHPQARIYRMRPWEGFHETYWLDPADPLFARLAGRFLDLYDLTYGKGRYYLADAFNEMLPPVAGSSAPDATYGDATANRSAAQAVDPAVKAEKLGAYGRFLHDSVRARRPDAVWVMQGWLFGADKTFWTADAIAAFLRDVPDDGMMVLDIGNDRYPDTHRTAAAFHGKAWVYGYVHNYGGSNPVYGDLDFYREDTAAIAAAPDRGNLQGFGVFPEGLHSNAVVYEYLYDQPWGGGKSLPQWLAHYTRARYGKTSPQLVDAWLKVHDGVFRTRYWSPRWWHDTAGAYLLCKRPDVAMAGYEGAPGQRAALRAGLERLLALSHDFAASPLFRTDLTDFARHLVSLHLDDAIKQAIASYQAGDITAGDTAARSVSSWTLALDEAMGTQPCHLAGWIAEARAYGTTSGEQDYYERNARTQVTIWGGEGNLHDYASKAWQGLYADFYLPRWQLMFAALRTAAAAKSAFDPAAVKAQLITWERRWAQTVAPVSHRVPADPAAGIRRLLAGLPPERPGTA